MRTLNPAYGAFAAGMLILCAAAGCNLTEPESGNSSDPVPPPEPAGVEFTMNAANLDWTVFVDDRAVGRLHAMGERVSIDLKPGQHAWYVWNHDYQRRSESVSFSLNEQQRRRYLLGNGTVSLRWIQ